MNDKAQPGAAASHPSALVRIDRERRELHSSIVIVGTGADELANHIHQTTGGNQAGKINLTPPGESSYSYFRMQLGELRGFKTFFHIYSFRSDERLVATLEDFLPHANAIIVAQENAGDISEVFRAAARRSAMSGQALPAALLASDDVLRAWTQMGGARPIFTAAMSKDAVMPAVKAVARQVLLDITQAQSGGAPSGNPSKP